MKRIIIGGLPRCGTTLLANLLNAQDGCTFVTAYLDAFEQLADTLRVRFDERLRTSQRKAALLKAREQMLVLRHPFLATPDDFQTLDGLHRLALADIAAPGDVVVGHKARLDPTRVERLLTTTDIHVVIMLRDPRDAAVSWWYRTGSAIEPYVEEWKRMVRYAWRSAHERVYILRFEDLVCAPENALRKLLDDVGLRFRVPPALTALRDAREGTGVWLPNTAHADVTRVLDPAATRRWRDAVTSPVVRYAGWACRAELQGLGYDPMKQAPPAELAAFAAAQLSHRIAERLRRLTHACASAVERWGPRIEPTD